MRYSDGRPVALGDAVKLWADRTGTVVGAIENDEYLDGFLREDWSYLGSGVLIRTGEGIFHYPQPDEDLELVERRSRPARSPTVV